MTVSNGFFAVAAVLIVAEFVVAFATKRKQLSYALGACGLSMLGASALADGITVENVIMAAISYTIALIVIGLASRDARKKKREAYGQQS